MVYFFLFCWVGLCVVCGYITHTLCFWFFFGGGWGFQSSFCMLSWIVYLVYAHLIYLVYEHRPERTYY